MTEPNDSERRPVPPPNAVFGEQSIIAQEQDRYAAPNADATEGPGRPPAHPKHRKPMPSGLKTFAFGFLGALVACAVAFCCYAFLGVGRSSTTLGSTSSTQITASDTGTQLAEQVSDKVLPSVVSVEAYTAASSMSSLLGGSSGSTTSESLGSGVILSSDGYVLTNYHVIDGAAKLEVTTGGGDTYTASVVGTDATSDLAVLKISASGLTAADIGSSADLKTGEWVMAAGNPYGLEQSVSTGIVSATSRTVSTSSSSSSSSSGSAVYTNMIQTDAAINPGNSGGALVDSNGKLIGINTLIESESGSSSGVGFAIPVDYAISIAQQIINGETPTHAQLGVSVATVNSQNAASYGFKVSSGAYVASISSGSGAANAGIQQGDIITKFNGEAVDSASDLIADVRKCNPNDTVPVEVNRDGTTMTFNVTLGSDSGSTTTSSYSSSVK